MSRRIKEEDSYLSFEDDEDIEDDSSYFNSRTNRPQVTKREHHNRLERERRQQIKNSFQILREAIPSLNGENGKSKASRAQILKECAKFILDLKQRCARKQATIDNMKKTQKEMEDQIMELKNSKQHENKPTLYDSSSVSNKRKANVIARYSSKGTVFNSSGLSSSKPSSQASCLSSTKPVIRPSVPNNARNDSSSLCEFDARNLNISSDLSNTITDYRSIDLDRTRNDNSEENSNGSSCSFSGTENETSDWNKLCNENDSWSYCPFPERTVTDSSLVSSSLWDPELNLGNCGFDITLPEFNSETTSDSSYLQSPRIIDFASSNVNENNSNEKIGLGTCLTRQIKEESDVFEFYSDFELNPILECNIPNEEDSIDFNFQILTDSDDTDESELSSKKFT